MGRMNQRWIKKIHNEKGEPICLIPECSDVAQKYKTVDKYRNYCKNHNCWDMSEYTNWQQFARKILRRDNYTCVICGDQTKYVERTFKNGMFKGYTEPVSNLEVDHINEVADGGEMWDENNCRTLCLKCHRKKTKDSARLRRLGKGQKRLL